MCKTLSCYLPSYRHLISKLLAIADGKLGHKGATLALRLTRIEDTGSRCKDLGIEETQEETKQSVVKRMSR